MTTVLVAAGGGGDALAASILHRAPEGDAEGAVIATYAWDRLSVDPLPGPRSASDFIGLQPIGRRNYGITPGTKPRPPSGSTLPRLAAEIPDSVVLLDPAHGAVGIRTQIAELASVHAASRVSVVDVGGDTLAKGREPGLRSPLADGLVLAACTDLDTPVRVLVAGPGLDGELPEQDVLAATGTTALLELDATHVAPYISVLDWHPSEATALLAAAAKGLRGRVEIRDAGLIVELTDHSPRVYALGLEDAIATNRLADALTRSSTLTEAEAVTREMCGFCEIDYERAKANRLDRLEPAMNVDELDDAVRGFEREAAARGVHYVTFRRIAEAMPLPPGRAAELRRHLITTRPSHLAWPLWSLVPTRVHPGPTQSSARVVPTSD